MCEAPYGPFSKEKALRSSKAHTCLSKNMLYPDFNELVKLGARARKLSITSRRRVMSSVSGDSNSPFRGHGMEFKEVRQYVAGDDVRYIDWRVTARTGTPHLKVFAEERERSVIICVDANAAMQFGTRGTFKSIQAARAAALLGWRANDNNDLVGASVFGNVPDGMQFFAPSRTRKSLWQMLKLLCEKDGKTHTIITLEDTLKHLNKAAPTGALVFIISDFFNLTADLEKQLSLLRKRCEVVLLPVNDPADSTLPPIGNLLFSDSGNKVLVNTDSASGRKTYHKQWEKNKAELDEITRKLRLGMINLYTDKDVFDDLMLGLKKVGRK
jgi:uncharacterized protein (DUF58 family)